MWRCELNSVGSDGTEWRIFERMAVILWQHKAGALLEHQSGRICRRRLGIKRRGCGWYRHVGPSGVLLRSAFGLFIGVTFVTDISGNVLAQGWPGFWDSAFCYIDRKYLALHRSTLCINVRSTTQINVK
jgi:hypothetical protein